MSLSFICLILNYGSRRNNGIRRSLSKAFSTSIENRESNTLAFVHSVVFRNLISDSTIKTSLEVAFFVRYETCLKHYEVEQLKSMMQMYGHSKSQIS